ncbi:hypothetical protein D9M68_932810 [compost metagenome]
MHCHLGTQVDVGAAGQGQGDGVDVGQPGEQRHQVHADIAEPASRTLDEKQDQRQQRGEAQCRAKFEGVLQRRIGVLLGLVAGAAKIHQCAAGVDQRGHPQRPEQLR